MTEKTALLIWGHGYELAEAKSLFNKLVKSIEARLSGMAVAVGHLGVSDQSLSKAAETLIQQGADTIVCMRGDLPTGYRAMSSLDQEISETAKRHISVSFHKSTDLSADARVLTALRNQIEKAEATGSQPIARQETVLVIVARGSKDDQQNADVAKMTRMIWEGMGFGWAETCYTKEGAPNLDEGLIHATRLGFKRILTVPYYLYPDPTLADMDEQLDQISAAHPEVDFITAQRISDHTLLADSFAERVREALDGSNSMNCMQCSYREQIIGPASGHSHSHEHPHDHSHGHSHSHSHSHGHSHTPTSDT